MERTWVRYPGLAFYFSNNYLIDLVLQGPHAHTMHLQIITGRSYLIGSSAPGRAAHHAPSTDSLTGSNCRSGLILLGPNECQFAPPVSVCYPGPFTLFVLFYYLFSFNCFYLINKIIKKITKLGLAFFLITLTFFI